ncbi:GH1 family beta-glucosidase [Streptomyces sp. NPDC058656]|uniref:GH1 family beta-glucosidase n=1 Tax=unclassified Streptomyces TaxID=2593676 RepID=UPI00366855C0
MILPIHSQSPTEDTEAGAELQRTDFGFTESFLIGAATASYQIEGAVNEGGRGPSIWDTFSHTPGKVLNGDSGDVADDHYHRLEEDLDLIAGLRIDAYRFSIAWPRIQPTGRGPSNPEGIAFYNRLIDGLLERGVKPVATLYHWDLPQALEDEGGWVNRATSFAFAEYARIAGEAFGDRVAIWSTLNEPWCAAFLGYGEGTHAPGRTSHREALTAAHHLNLAHGLGLVALRETVSNPLAQYSVTLNTAYYVGEGEGGDEAVRRLDGVANRIFTGPMLKGAYPEDLLADTAEITDWSFVLDGDETLINQPIDFLGVNYYFTQYVTLDPHANRVTTTGGTATPGADDVRIIEKPGPRTLYGWSITPEGLEGLLLSLTRQFPGLPLVITENGASFDDQVVIKGGERRVHDPQRIDFLVRHFESARRAIDQGVDIRGYFVWSLLDNFEWSRGYKERFGLIHVDYETLTRTPKDSARWLSTVAAGRKPSTSGGTRHE